MFEPIGPPPLAKNVTKLLTLWCMLIPFWFFSAMGAAGFRTEVGGDLFVISWGLYPVLLFLALFFKRSKPYASLLPFLSLIAMFISGRVDDMLRHT
jgi:hypothetical protein